jgi:hypothetical protein
MNEDFVAAVVAGGIVLGAWACVAALIGYLAHRRMRRVERSRGGPALPRDELPLLFMALAAFALPVASIVALGALVHAPWSRLGRNATFVAIAQMTACVLASSAVAARSVFEPPKSTIDELVPMVVAASAMVAAGALVATALLWIWAGRRASRFESAPARGATRPGWWRFLIYAASLLLWPLGLALGVAWTAPENARAGANALRCSTLNVLGISLGVCVALPILVRMLG